MIGLKFIRNVVNTATTEDASLQKTTLFVYAMMAIPETAVANVHVSQLSAITKMTKIDVLPNCNVEKIY